MPLFISSFLRLPGDGRGIGNAWANRSVCGAPSRQGPLQIMTKNDHVNHLIFLSSPCVCKGKGWGGALLQASGFHPRLLLHHLDKSGVVDKGEQKGQESCIVVLLVSLLRGLLDETRRAGLVSESEAESAREGRGGNRPPGKLA